ncbi:MAG TPA: NAD(P)/FAD-dependent oxidoreductase [Thermoanaerobaculia bacterium]|nr:NAD(P)/FAD-dependent oxidoreductase [Thermoanaerobaculia bacterium]HUM29607.1 NAD(P)/FAD-dependent oxidoreductase [Thermoanaerobaculia bacterium]HXK67258.1 NAD(P)/FAD-dependent oxidoreductase [Thermoanaerobaculia bacterium]
MSSRLSEARVAVVGAGPAGIACAVQLVRAGIPVDLYDPAPPGGTLREAWRVENYPGFPEGISGQELADRIGRALTPWNILPVPEQVEGLRRTKDGVCLEAGGRSLDYPAAVVATGSRPRRLEGIATEAGSEEKIFTSFRTIRSRGFRRIAIYGAGDVGLDWAEGLSAQAEVHVLFRGSHPRGLDLLVDRARQRGVTFRPCFQLEAIQRHDQGIRLTGSEGNLHADALLLALGRVPRLDFLDSGIEIPNRGGTIDGRIYFAGDAVNGYRRQTAIAAGDGLHVAMEVKSQWK